MCNDNWSNISKLLEKILLLQNMNSIQEGCSKPYLGENGSLKPINLYSCCTGSIWSIPYKYDGIDGNSTTFKIENINDNYATFRILIPTDNGYRSTDNFFTIDLKYISCIKCLENILIDI